MEKEIREGTAPHSWGKGFVQSDYTKHGIDRLGAIYAAYYPFFHDVNFFYRMVIIPPSLPSLSLQPHLRFSIPESVFLKTI